MLFLTVFHNSCRNWKCKTKTCTCYSYRCSNNSCKRYNRNAAMYKTRNTGRETGNVAIHFGECRQTFREMSSNISGIVTKHSGECCQTFQWMSSNIPENVAKHSWECRQTLQRLSSNIYCLLQIALSNVSLSKSVVGGLSMGHSFINLFHCLQSICYYHFMLWMAKFNMRWFRPNSI